MRLNHLDLHVPDVAATRDVLVSAFGLTEVGTRGANGLAILRDDAGLELVISRPVEKFGGGDAVSVGLNTYHIGFMQPSREAVDALFAVDDEEEDNDYQPGQEDSGWCLWWEWHWDAVMDVGTS